MKVGHFHSLRGQVNRLARRGEEVRDEISASDKSAAVGFN